MRIDALISGGDDGVSWYITLSHDRRIDDAFENLRGEARAVKIQISIFPDLAAPDRVDARFHSALRRTKRLIDEAHLFLRFHFPIRPEWIGRGLNADIQDTELIGE